MLVGDFKLSAILRKALPEKYYYMALKDNYARCSSTIMSYPQFKFSWYGFLERVCSVINFEEGFKCQHCGSSPDHVIMDATTLAHRKNFKVWHEDLRELASDNIKQIPYRYASDDHWFYFSSLGFLPPGISISNTSFYGIAYSIYMYVQAFLFL